jgi:hypothetical protein
VCFRGAKQTQTLIRSAPILPIGAFIIPLAFQIKLFKHKYLSAFHHILGASAFSASVLRIRAEFAIRG